MDIVSRMKAFMSKMQISNSQFADACGVPRPSLSQILSGRNKKISSDLIAKIHGAYPSLSIPWLMFDEGQMLASPTAAQSLATPSREEKKVDRLTIPSPEPRLPLSEEETDLVPHAGELDFSSVPTSEDSYHRPGTKSPSTVQRPPSAPTSSDPLSFISDTPPTLANPSDTFAYAANTAAQTALSSKSAQMATKQIQSIMVFYTDNSFERFYPK